MKMPLLASDLGTPCDQAEKVWRRVVAEREPDFPCETWPNRSPTLADRLPFNTIPALVANDVRATIGVQTPDEARALKAPARKCLE